jgi:hypothetical protein
MTYAPKPEQFKVEDQSELQVPLPVGNNCRIHERIIGPLRRMRSKVEAASETERFTTVDLGPVRSDARIRFTRAGLSRCRFPVPRTPWAGQEARQTSGGAHWFGAVDAGDDSWLAGRLETHYLTARVALTDAEQLQVFVDFFE